MHTALSGEDSKQQRKELVLGGVGGIGKTQLAIAYANRFRDQYASVFWLDATSEAKVKASFCDVAGQLFAVEGSTKLDVVQSIKHTKGWLSDPRNTHWLLIFDNYDDPKEYDFKEFKRLYYPEGSHGSVIITTRRPDHFPKGKTKLVQPLSSVEDGIEILRTRSGRDDAPFGMV